MPLFVHDAPYPAGSSLHILAIWIRTGNTLVQNSIIHVFLSIPGDFLQADVFNAVDMCVLLLCLCSPDSSGQNAGHCLSGC